jgi:hypothetical protein
MRADLGGEWRGELEATIEGTKDVPVTGLVKALWFAASLVIHGPAIARALSGTEQTARFTRLRGYLSRLNRNARSLGRRLGGFGNAGRAPSGIGSPSASAADPIALRWGASAAATVGLALAVAFSLQTALAPRPGGVPVAGPAPAHAPAIPPSQAAASLAGLLAQSVTDRAALINAAAGVGACGPNLASAPSVFSNGATSREALLTSLSAMPGRTALPPALLSDLTQAWQASVAADQAYAKWANDEIAQGCVPNDVSDRGYQETVTPNIDATESKAAFAAAWTPVATHYGLTQYQQGQI